jgi:acetoin utilization deacetylase AcuC-like enzyme
VGDYGTCVAAPLYFRHEASLEHDTGGHPEGPGRIPAIEGELERRGWLGYERREAPEVDMAALHAIHPTEYVAEVRDMAAGGGGWFDADTVASAGSYGAALHAAGGACAMVEALVGGEAPVAFCGLRPPGHHAEPARAMGFCLFNNVAIAARHALDSLGIERVLILDWDVHHGNGTNDVFYSSDQVLFASIHQSPLYPGTGRLTEAGSGEGEGFTMNLPVPPGSEEPTWVALVERVVLAAAREFQPELVLVSAGFDAHRADPLASCSLETESFGTMAAHVRLFADELGVPVGAVLEGGYDLDALSSSVAVTLAAFADGNGSAPPPPSYGPDAVVERAIEQVGRYWKL